MPAGTSPSPAATTPTIDPRVNLAIGSGADVEIGPASTEAEDRNAGEVKGDMPAYFKAYTTPHWRRYKRLSAPIFRDKTWGSDPGGPSLFRVAPHFVWQPTQKTTTCFATF